MTDIDASEVFSERPKGPSREQTQKTVYDKFPGHISWATDSANFSGCRIITFFDDLATSGLSEDDAAQLDAQLAELTEDQRAYTLAADLMNLYFSKRANLLLVHMVPGPEQITCLITTQLDEDDLAEFEEVQRRVQLDMREWREKRDKDREEAAQAAREERRLIEVGRKAETYNLFAKLRELEEEVKTLKAAAKEAASADRTT